MPATSSNAGLVIPTNAGDPGVWGNENNATIASLDTRLAGTTTILSSVSGLSYTISSAAAQCGRLVLGGVPAGPATWTFSSANYAMGQYSVWNTSSGYGLTCQTLGGGATCTVPLNSQRVVTCDGTNAYFADQVPVPFIPFLSGFLGGLTLSNDASSPNDTLDISAGTATDSTAAAYMSTASVFTKKTTSAWIAGPGNAGMGTGVAVAINTWYHVFIIQNAGAVDFYFDTSATAANAPAGTTYFRRIGSFKTDASGHIMPFQQTGDYVWLGEQLEYDGGTRTYKALSLAFVPPGAPVQPIVYAFLLFAAGSWGFSQLGQQNFKNATLYGGTGGNNISATSGQFVISATSNAQIFYSAGVNSGTLSEATLYTVGYIDTRGR